MKSIESVAVFCGSSSGSLRYQNLARQLGASLAKGKKKAVYGGASVGLMGCLADACLEHGGRVVGVMPEALVKREIAHASLTELVVVETMQERKYRMMALADGFAVLPGGYGTYDELFEVITFRQIGLIAKPVVLINVDGFYDALVAQITRAVSDGFINREAQDYFGVVLDVEETIPALERLAASIMSSQC